VEHGNERGNEDDQVVKMVIDSGTNDLADNKKGKENLQNDSVNPAEPSKLVTEGKVYFKAWPNPQGRRGEGT